MSARIRPRQWRVPAPMLAGIAVVALTSALGGWQLARAHARTERQARIEAMARGSAQWVTARPIAADRVMDRPVRLRGAFDTTRTVLLENRPRIENGVSHPGFEVLTPLILEGGGGRAALINRGWLPRDAADRTRIAPYFTPPGAVQIEGIAVPRARRVHKLGRDVDETGQRLRQNIELDAFARETGLSLHPFVVEQRSRAADGLRRDWPRADAGADRNYGYAFQWFAMSATALALMIFHGARRDRGQRHPA